jgi:cell division protein FtsB
MVKDQQKTLLNRALFLAGLALFFLLIFGLIKELVNRRSLDRQIEDYRNSISRLQTDNAILSDKVISWEKSSELEANARAKLGLEKPGEHTIVIVRQKTTETSIVKSDQTVIDLSNVENPAGYEPNPAKWWRYFFGS